MAKKAVVDLGTMKFTGHFGCSVTVTTEVVRETEKATLLRQTVTETDERRTRERTNEVWMPKSMMEWSTTFPGQRFFTTSMTREKGIIGAEGRYTSALTETQDNA